MFPSVRTHSKLLTLVALALGLAALVAACSSSTPTPTPPPTPTPTPTPVPEPIVNLGGNATFADLAALLSEEAVGCISGELGVAAYDTLLERRLFSEGLPFDADFPFDCFDPDDFMSVVIAALSAAAGGLSDATAVCLRETFSGLDVRNLVGLTGAQFDSDSLSTALGATIGLLLCLTDDEAGQITAGGLFGDIGGASALSLADLRCVIEVVDVGTLLGLFETLESGGTPDLTAGLSLLTAVNECGVDLGAMLGGGGDGGGTDDPAPQAPDLSDFDLSQIDQLPPEAQVLINCLVDVLGEEKVTGLLDGTYIPAFEDFAAIGQCSIDLSALGDIGSLLGG